MFTEKKEETVTEFQKSQTVRVLDLVVVAPVLVYAGAIKSNLPTWVRLSLIGLGVATFVYNGSNYLENKNQKKQ